MFSAIFLGALVTNGGLTSAQSRVSDKDVETLMKNLAEDAKSFRSSFDSSVRKTTIRKTSREKDAKASVLQFEQQIRAMGANFRKTKKADPELTGVLTSAGQIDKLLYDIKPDAQTTSKWGRVQAELRQLSPAFGLSYSDNRPGSPTVSNANDLTCVQTAGTDRASRLVQQCLHVSPATHPPCNAQNSCALIINEIKRGCALIRPGAPAFCDEY